MKDTVKTIRVCSKCGTPVSKQHNGLLNCRNCGLLLWGETELKEIKPKYPNTLRLKHNNKFFWGTIGETLFENTLFLQ